MITLENVSKRYGPVLAVNEVSFTIDKGEVIGLVGPNGAGKTTTMKMITGYLVPTAGRITVDGDDVVADPRPVQAKIGYLPEHAPLYPEMPVQDYLMFMGRMRGHDGARLRERLAFVVDACGLRTVITRPIKHLSKGFRQRVGISQAIIHDPSILILDEPTSGLDPNQIIEIRDLIKELGKTRTVILSTHILAEVEEACSRAIIIAGGRKVADDKITNLVGGKTVRLALDGGVDPTKKIAALEMVESVHAVGDTGYGGARVYRVVPKGDAALTRELYKLAVKENWNVAELHVERRSLEDVFREVSTKGV